jgi:oligoribonuclease
MTGLLPERDRIIEVAVVVTDPQITVRIEGPVFAIHQSDAVLDGMDAWNKGTHGKSGLIDRVKASTSTRPRPSAVIAFLEATWAAARARCAATASARTGASWPRTCRRWRPSSTTATSTSARSKELARRWKPAALDGFKKAQAHTALADIHESIDELLHYRQHLLAV